MVDLPKKDWFLTRSAMRPCVRMVYGLPILQNILNTRVKDIIEIMAVSYTHLTLPTKLEV